MANQAELGRLRLRRDSAHARLAYPFRGHLAALIEGATT